MKILLQDLEKTRKKITINLTLWGNFCNVDGQTIQTMFYSGQIHVHLSNKKIYYKVQM
jgi:hypothetical protein